MQNNNAGGILMHIPLTISPTGQITSSGGEGSHLDELNVTQVDCSVTQSYAPDFTTLAAGELVGSNMYLAIAPSTDWALTYTVTCIVDDEPLDIPLPPYNYPLPSIMAGQIFKELELELRSGEFVAGSDQDTQWGEDYPISYRFTITAICRRWGLVDIRAGLRWTS